MIKRHLYQHVDSINDYEMDDNDEDSDDPFEVEREIDTKMNKSSKRIAIDIENRVSEYKSSSIKFPLMIFQCRAGKETIFQIFLPIK